jgi:alpha-glucosidase (family GH31 glycosyl hydrolase)
LGFKRPKISSYASHKRNYDFKYTAKPFSFKVVRKSDKETIFDTSNLPFVFEDQYLELSTHVPKDANIYGFGEVTAPFRRTTVSNLSLVSMFSKSHLVLNRMLLPFGLVTIQTSKVSFFIYH